MRINWRKVCKLLSGAFFVSAGEIWYISWEYEIFFTSHFFDLLLLRIYTEIIITFWYEKPY